MSVSRFFRTEGAPAAAGLEMLVRGSVPPE